VVGEAVAVVDPDDAVLGFSLGGCDDAVATTGADGRTVLSVAESRRFHVLASIGGAWHGAVAGPFVAREGLVVDVLQFDTTHARTGDCGRPVAPALVPDDHQFAPDLVPVHVTVVDPRHDTALSGATVAAVDVAASPNLMPDRFFSDCVLAFATTTEAVVLWLQEGIEVRFIVQHGIARHMDEATYTVRDGATFAVPRYDPEGVAANACGRPPPPFGLPDDQAYARDVVPFRLQALLDGAPVQGLTVAAVDTSDGGPFGSLDLDRFFNPCVVAMARTAADGNATFYLEPGDRLHFVVTPFIDDPVGAAWGLNITGDATFALDLVPLRKTHTFTTRLVTPLPEHVPIRFDDDAEVQRDAIERLRRFPFPEIQWVNEDVQWADLWLGMAVGEEARWTQDTFDREQGPGDGEVSETLLGADFEWLDHRCDAVEQGLSVEVVAPDLELVAPLGLEVTVVFDARFDLPYYYDDTIREERCP